MNTQEFIQKGTPLIFCGCKIKLFDLKNCLLKLTDLSGALHSFSIRVIKSERPRRKLIIDIELAQGFDPDNYNADTYLYELISRMRKLSRNFREYIRTVPAESFPELCFHAFGLVAFNESLYKIRNSYFF